MDRPSVYRYWDQLIEHIGDPNRIFDGNLTWPRQLEIHLPGNHKQHCNFNCFYCAGKRFVKELGTWEIEGLDLIKQIGTRIPYHVYGGSFTEEIINPYFMAYLATTKHVGCHFGIHTNGSMLKRLEENQGWITELCRIAEDNIDYLSISLDAGSPKNHCLTKNVTHDWFSEILEGIRLACEIRRGDKPAVRLCYLLNKFNASAQELESIVKFARETGVDSLRFSIPFAHYAQSFTDVRKYKKQIEDTYDPIYHKLLEPHLSKDVTEKPFIFYFSPELQSIDLFDFQQCAYGYYQICLGADGYIYRCTTISSPTFKQLRLGKITSDLEEFKTMIQRNQDPYFDACYSCFKCGARCNRMGLEVNRGWRDFNERMGNLG